MKSMLEDVLKSSGNTILEYEKWKDEVISNYIFL